MTEAAGGGGRAKGPQDTVYAGMQALRAIAAVSPPYGLGQGTRGEVSRQEKGAAGCHEAGWAQAPLEPFT